MYTIKNLTEKSLKQDLLEEFLDFVNEELKINKPYSVYFVEDKHNASDALGKTAMYNPSTNSVYIYVTNRHPKDILRSIAHELVHHKQHCNGDLEKMSLEDAEIDANAGGYLLRQFEDGRKNKQLNEKSPYGGSASYSDIGSPSDRGESYYAAREIEKINKNPNLTDREKKQMATAIKKKTYPVLFGIKNMKLEQVSELLDIVGMVPGVGDVVDLSNVIPKSILAYRYSFGPKKNEKFNFPFDLGSIDMSTFYYIDLAITLLSAFTIGEPLKVAKRAIQKGTATAKDIFVFSDLSLKILQPFLVMGKPQTVLYRILRVLGKGNKAEVDEYLEKVTETLKTMKEGAEKIQNARKFVNFKKADELMSRTNQLGGYEAFEFLMGGGLLGKITPDIAKVKNVDEYVETVDNLTNAILLKKAEQISKTALKITDPKRFDEFLEIARGSEKLSGEALANLTKLDDDVKKSLGYIIEKLYKGYGNVDQIRDTIVTPLAAAAKKGVSDKEKIEGFINELIKVAKNNDAFDGQMIPILKKIDWSKGLEGVSDYYKNLAQRRFQAGELSLAARKIVGDSDVVKSAMTKANKEIAESLKVMEEIRKNPRFLETATKEQSDAFKRIDGPDWMSKVYEKNMAQVRGQLLQSGSKLVSDLSTNMAKKADELSVSIVGPLRRGPEKVSSFIAKNIVKNPKFASLFVKFFNKNFFGKTYASNTFIVSGRIVNGAAAVLDFFGRTQRAAKVAAAGKKLSGTLIDRVSSGLIASAMFYWLRVLENEELAGGGGNPNVGKEQEGMKGDAEKASEASEIVKAHLEDTADSEMEPADLASQTTSTVENLRKKSKDTSNPNLKTSINKIIAIFDQQAKDFEKAKSKQDVERANKKAADALRKKANAEQKAAEGKLRGTVSKSPEVSTATDKAKRGARADTSKARGAATKAGQQAARSAGAGGSGKGGGLGAGIGGGIGDGIGEGGPLLTSLVRYVDKRLGDYDVEEDNYPSTADKSKRKTHADSGIKDVPKQLGDLLVNTVIKYRAKRQSQASANKVIINPEIVRSFTVSDKLEDIKKYNEFLKWLRSLNKKLDTIQKLQETKSLTKYRQEVLNERLEKLTKGLTK